MTVFETTVTKVGPEASNMITDAGMFILFGEGAPEDLAEFCFTHSSKAVNGPIQKGGYVVIDDQEYLITAVGSVVEQNLANLGHITVSLDGAGEPTLPGTLHIQAPSAPQIGVGTVIQIFE